MNKLTAEEGLHKYIHNRFRENKKQKQEEKKYPQGQDFLVFLSSCFLCVW